MDAAPRTPWLPDLLSGTVRGALAAALAGGSASLRAAALAPAARVLALAGLVRAARGPLLVVTASENEARSLASDLAETLEERLASRVVRLPAMDADPYRGMPVHPSIAARRVAALDRLASGEPIVLVLQVASLFVPVPPAASLRRWARSFEKGSEVELDELALAAVEAGYRVVDIVSSPGDLARRGGLFDIWPPQEEQPLRVELFGDEVESIRRFDAATQRTVETVESFRMLPAAEAPIGPAERDALLDRLLGGARRVFEEEGSAEQTLIGLEAAPSLYRDDLVAIDGMVEAPLVVWGPDECDNALADRWAELATAHAESEGTPLPPPEELFPDPDDLRARLQASPLTFADLPLQEPGREVVDLVGRPAPAFEGRLESLPETLVAARDAGRPIVLLTRGRGRQERLSEILADAGLDARVDDPLDAMAPLSGEIVLASGGLDHGVELGTDGALVLAEHDLFGPDPPPPPQAAQRRREKAFVSDLRDLKESDLVVHVDHGVARYTGLAKSPVTGEEMLLLEYSAGDRLFVPVSRLDLIQKYSGGEQRTVPLDKLGGQGWDRRRRKVRKEVEKIAGELLDLYARRRAIKAHAYGADNDWQREFESAFPHTLTEDQSSALTDIKGDLRSGRAMDRLLCGDVGYGKTEVALRAAFKVVQEGFQVAVLVPTTVLAFQHLATFRARMASWPLRIEMISRFTSPAGIRERVEAAGRGDVDILIGTHRLLSQDVSFKRLGLLVIDEEQRFGVKQKERIKKLALGVHVLSMSATPIPRTLQMSLAGVRDLSVIETPPRNRLAIQTQLTPWSDTVVATAIRNELRRSGQVFFITPRIEGLERLVRSLRELIPGAKIDGAHGQMPEHRLEESMLRFVRGETQVLVATSIIENGLDIPRANTILIHQAHRFGLAQLYQMRGRVGRSDQRAYAYLLVPSTRELTEEARKRLSALVEFSDLGAGFRIAALDLEIRGAGEFLGAKQSGHIAAVGFELYIGMLERAVRRLRGEELEHAPDPVAINLGIPAFVPEELVPEAGQRLALYKRLSAAMSPEEVDALQDELADRYGKLPDPARNLFRQARLRLVAAGQGAVSIDWADGAIAVRYGERPKVDTDKIVSLMQEDSGVRITPGGVVRMRVPDERSDRVAAASLALRKLAMP